MEISKEVVKELMDRHVMCSFDEAVEALQFASEILEEEADETEKNEPYATKTIRRYRDAAYDLFEFAQEIERM